MRSPSKSVTKRVRDAESELNLPPGFRFHPTDEELIVHYLCRKSGASHRQSTAAPPPIIADVDLYKHDPWELPEMALFGTKEWYFFTPRDRKYPNGSRPNRVTGNGYWKATGADKPITQKSDPNTVVGIKKALVFYAGKGPKGVKTNWIMHEYRLATPNSPSQNAITSKLDDWVLCRLYNKKNNPGEKVIPKDNLHRMSPLSEIQKENNNDNTSDSFNSFEESDIEFDGNFIVNNKFEESKDEGDVTFLSDSTPQPLTLVNGTSDQCKGSMKMENFMQRDDDGNEWLDNFSLEDLQHFLEAMPSDGTQDFYQMPMIYHSNQQHFSF